MNKNQEFLENMINSYSPVSLEKEGQKVFTDYISEYVDTLRLDAYGNAIATIKCGSENAKKVLIEAHVDEIAWMVMHIESNGLVRVSRHGGSDNMIARSKEVVIITDSGAKIPAVFGSAAIHTRKAAVENGPDVHELYLDLGVDSKEEVLNLGVEVGNVAVFTDTYKMMGKYHTGRALDNRIGSYIIATVAEMIKQNNVELGYDLVIANCVQEEVGLHGASMVASSEKPDLVIVHDVCHNTSTPGYSNAKECETIGGKGVAIEYTAQNHRGLVDFAVNIAKDIEIPYQRTKGSYGNDTMSFFRENGGTPTMIMATPLKYMHTTVEMAHVDDVNAVIDLMYNMLISLSLDDIEKFNGITLK